MLDLSNIPSQQQQTYTFYATGNWQTWNKPRNAKFIEIFCLGSGGGGARGGSSTSAAGGAASGASGGITRGLIPAFLLPDTLYISVARGGLGMVATNIRGDGGISYVSLQPSTSEQTLICKSSTTAAGGADTNNIPGTAPTISVISLSAFGNLGLFTAIAGVAGSNAGANTPTAGSSQAALATNIVTGGGGGGGHRQPSFGAGGNITSASAILTTQVNGGVTSGQNGDSGYGTLQPFCGTGGAGGAGVSSATTTGGRGGNGWYGCGGGGGGAGGFNITSLGGNGGNGGNGLVIITVIT